MQQSGFSSLLNTVAQNTASPAHDFGKRIDGTPKGNGFLGPLKFHDGRTSSELSAGLEINGKETEMPLLVPTLTQQEVDHLLQGNPATPEIEKKAIDHAMERIKAGKSPFAGPEDAPQKPSGGQRAVDSMVATNDPLSPAAQAAYKRATGSAIDASDAKAPVVPAESGGLGTDDKRITGNTTPAQDALFKSMMKGRGINDAAIQKMLDDMKNKKK